MKKRISSKWALPLAMISLLLLPLLSTLPSFAPPPDDRQSPLDTIQNMLDEIESTIRWDHDLMIDDLQMIQDECTDMLDRVTIIEDKLDFWFSQLGRYRNTAQVTSYSGQYIVTQTNTEFRGIIYRSDELATITVALQIEGIQWIDSGCWLEYYIDPTRPDFYIEKAAGDFDGFFDTAVAWQVYVRLVISEGEEGDSTINFAVSGIHQPE